MGKCQVENILINWKKCLFLGKFSTNLPVYVENSKARDEVLFFLFLWGECGNLPIHISIKCRLRRGGNLSPVFLGREMAAKPSARMGGTRSPKAYVRPLRIGATHRFCRGGVPAPPFSFGRIISAPTGLGVFKGRAWKPAPTYQRKMQTV